MTALKIESVSIESLDLDPDNARRHSARNLQAIAHSLKEFGQRRPIVLHGDTVIAGNGTLQAAQALGWKTISATRVPAEWPVERAKAFAIADNRTAELASWDGQQLLDTLQNLDDTLLQATGFQANDLKDLDKVWGAPPDLDIMKDELDDLLGEDDGYVTVKLKLPIIVHDKWRAAVKATGLPDEAEAINLVIAAAFDALTDGEL